jgi:hypothetical protein
MSLNLGLPPSGVASSILAAAEQRGLLLDGHPP